MDKYDANDTIIDKIIIISITIITFITSIFFAFVYTPEYNGYEDTQNTKIVASIASSSIKTNQKGILNTPKDTPKNGKEWAYQKIYISRIFLVILIIVNFVVYAFFYKTFRKREKHLVEKIKHSNNREILLLPPIYKVVGSVDEDKALSLQNIIEQFVAYNADIISVQLYECSNTLIGDKLSIEVKPTSFHFTSNGNVVDIVHEKYLISQTLLNKYIEARNSYLVGEYELLSNLISSLTKQLSSYKKDSKKSVPEEIINKYSILTLAVQLDCDEIPTKLDGIDFNVQQDIKMAKRTGFLRGFIERDLYKFQHDGNSNKGKRYYITKCVEIGKLPHMFVIVLNPNISKKVNFNEYMDDVGNKFSAKLVEL